MEGAGLGLIAPLYWNEVLNEARSDIGRWLMALADTMKSL